MLWRGTRETGALRLQDLREASMNFRLSWQGISCIDKVNNCAVFSAGTNAHSTTYLDWQVTAGDSVHWRHLHSHRISSRCSGSRQTLRYCHVPSAVLPPDPSFHCYRDIHHLQYLGNLEHCYNRQNLQNILSKMKCVQFLIWDGRFDERNNTRYRIAVTHSCATVVVFLGKCFA